MKLHNTFAATLITALALTVSGGAFAKGPEQAQQGPAQMGQQSPVQMEQHQPPMKQEPKHAAPKKQKVHFIRVHSGDTLGKIAKKYHTSVTRLKRLNHLRNDTIYVGQRLRIS
ncbi:LysM peptidoglycan-binding domain-containing protein [Candidatus Thiothrix sp. Deng01]|uniref:LysM peptidoglycan-binding domain-containing protein n=1 Tax=Candidatus Thiothrix phosphatis TaxID=3112415 RepID=A0ABU6CRY2_9GAMM|nr:LysM peptidoglycan-binding domain-containing protein [Candidatus Thiothrix sp. Deng01]MEB4589600.1 LysM peptidoglycan-binding domain-containing protein [Candidatus Thiothrix sp. Deng01]